MLFNILSEIFCLCFHSAVAPSLKCLPNAYVMKAWSLKSSIQRWGLLESDQIIKLCLHTRTHSLGGSELHRQLRGHGNLGIQGLVVDVGHWGMPSKVPSVLHTLLSFGSLVVTVWPALFYPILLVIMFASPHTHRGGVPENAYGRQRNDFREAGRNTVEHDLVRLVQTGNEEFVLDTF